MLRRFIATIAAVMTAIVNMVRHRRHASVELAPGDRAPDFSLQGSDGRTYRLADCHGRSAVVLAWFPKAFTGG